MAIVLRLREVSAQTGRSRSAIYAAMAQGEFPKPIPLGAISNGRPVGRSVGWLESEILEWVEQRKKLRDGGAA